MTKDVTTIVFFKTGGEGAKVYYNSPEHSIEKLRSMGTVLIDPDLSKVRDVGQRDWRLKRGKIRPKFRRPLKMSINSVNFILLVIILLLKLREWGLI